MGELWVAICDDLEDERRALAQMVRGYARRRGRTVRFRFFASGDELLASSQQLRTCQILFLDIYMPGLSGVETARRLRDAGFDTAIVFATTSIDHGLDSFDVWAADYLTKPFREEEIDRALDWCLEHLPEPMRVLSVYSEGETQEFPLSSIRYLEVFGHKLVIHLSDGRVEQLNNSLSQARELLPQDRFLQCHRSYLVNKQAVRSLRRYEITLGNGEVVPVSKQRYREVEELGAR